MSDAKGPLLTYDPLIMFGRHLAKLRKKRGLSQEQLALLSGLGRSYLGGVERGQRNISLINICRLAETLHLPPSELLVLQTIKKDVAEMRE